MIRRYKLVYGAVAAVAFLGLLFLASFMGVSEEQQTVQIVVFGDSCYGNIRDESSITDRLEKLSGKTVYNAAFGGTCASRQDKEYKQEYKRESN